jgi:hypothetical protein
MSSVSEGSIDRSTAGRQQALDGRLRVPDHVVYRSFPGETVALNLNTGQYHGLNPIAERMIEVLTASDGVAEAGATLAEEYGQPQDRVEADLRELCADLLERDLIEPAPDSDG